MLSQVGSKRYCVQPGLLQFAWLMALSSVVGPPGQDLPLVPFPEGTTGTLSSRGRGTGPGDIRTMWGEAVLEMGLGLVSYLRTVN